MEKDTILIIEDMEINRLLLAEIFKDEYKILEAANGKEGIKLFVENFSSIAVVLIDLVMPVMDGFQVLELLSKKDLLSKVPFVMITGEDSVEYEKRGYEYGVVDYIKKPYHPDVVKQMVKNVIELFKYKNQLETLVKSQTAKLEAQNELLKKQAQKLRKMNEMLIDSMSNIVEFRNLESGQHVKRIREFTKCLGKAVMQLYPEYGITPEKLEIIGQASSMHDIGKIVIPDSILLKPGRLTPDEFEIIKSHTTKGAEMVEELLHLDDEEFYNYCYDIARHHHERYDGKGYPDGLKGEEIGIAAQIVSLADVYDALVSERVYKAAYSVDEAYRMILNGECGTFSPKLLKAFSAVKSEFEALAKKYSEDNEDE
ncbi:MAG: response regulator [Lachnospiraceae bacterium]|nr:response regulator [Lachnospiraceae bacterium]